MKNSFTLRTQSTFFIFLQKKIKLSLFFFLFFTPLLFGQVWTTIPPPTTFTNQSIIGVHFVDNQTGYVCGVNGNISKTIDCGVTWTNQISKTPSTLYSISFADSQHGVAVGDGGAIVVTSNAGLTWNPPTSIPPNANASAYRVVQLELGSGVGYIGGGVQNSYATILKTTDYGVNWTDISPSQFATNGTGGNVIYGISSIVGSTNVWATDFNGRILKTTNSNSTWSSIQVTTTNQLVGIHFINSLKGYAVGGSLANQNGVILETTNGGTSWNSLPVGDFLSGVKFSGATGYAVGGNPVSNTNGVIYKYNGNSWNKLIPPDVPSTPFGRLYGISLPSPTFGYTCGLGGTLLKTPLIDANFTFNNITVNNCLGYQFNSSGSNTSSYSWDFGDPMSGTNNTSLQHNPTHQFSKCGVFKVCLTASAGACNVTVCKDVTIVDNIPPLITNCSQNTTVNTNQGLCTYTILTPWTISAIDNCDPNPVITLTYTSPSGATSTTIPSVLPKGINTFVYQAKDKCNNVSKQCAFTITVVDTEKPTIICPQNVTVQGVSSPPPVICKATVNNIAPISFGDNCQMTTVTYAITGATSANGSNNASGTMFMQGVSTVTYTVTDMSGNTAMCSFTVTVVCTKCECSKFMNMYARVTQGAPNKSILCGDTLNITCKPTFNPIIGGFFQCIGGSACPDSALVNWVLNSPSSPNLGNGNIYAKPNFSLSLLGSYFNTSGVYELVLTGVCNGVKCMPCKVYFKVPPIDFSTNLTAYFPFSGNINDISPSLSNGIGTNITLNSANNAYIFNGTSSWIDGGNSNRGVTDQVSVCTWVKTTELTKGLWVAGQYVGGTQPKGYLLSIGNVTNGNIGLASFSGRVDVSTYYTATSLSTVKVNDGKWHCLVGTAGNGEWRIYVDGILRGSTPGLTTPSISFPGIGVPFSIGQASSGANPMWYNGEMDEVRVYNRVLNECEIESLCKAGSVSATNNLFEGKTSLRIFPNPNSGVFTVELPFIATEKMTLQITDLVGRLVSEKATKMGEQTQQVNIETLSSGLYILSLIDGNGKLLSLPTKFIKQ